jgi:hypothetical protein
LSYYDSLLKARALCANMAQDPKSMYLLTAKNALTEAFDAGAASRDHTLDGAVLRRELELLAALEEVAHGGSLELGLMAVVDGKRMEISPDRIERLIPNLRLKMHDLAPFALEVYDTYLRVKAKEAQG